MDEIEYLQSLEFYRHQAEFSRLRPALEANSDASGARRLVVDAIDEAERADERARVESDAAAASEGPAEGGAENERRASTNDRLPGQRTKVERAAERPSLKVKREGASSLYADARWRDAAGGWTVLGTVEHWANSGRSAPPRVGALIRSKATGTYYQLNGDRVFALDQRAVRQALLG
jgi:hypothetical protein